MTLAPDPVLLDVSPEGVATVTLNRPEKRNCFDELVIANLAEVFETLKGADHVRVVFLRGAGEVFCAGADIDWMRRQGERSQTENEADALAMARMFKALHELPQLTVALAHGAAMGGGVGLVAASDMGIALKTTRFKFSEVRLGLIPATIAPYVVGAMGSRWAGALFTTAEEFNGEFAEKIGLVHYAVADFEAMQQVMERIASLALAAAPGAVKESKALVRLVTGHKIDEALAKESAHRIAARRASPEGREGLAAFLEKRKPDWER